MNWESAYCIKTVINVSVLKQGFILRDSSHKPIRVSGTNADLAERKKMEKERRQPERHKQGFQKTENLNRMAAAIAHSYSSMPCAVMKS